MANFWKKLKKPIIGLAPMDGITDLPMRQVQVSVAKPGVMFTEFISVEGFLRNPRAFDRKISFIKNEKPVVVQVYGRAPEDFYQAVKKLSKVGFSGVDINMGCPARKVVDRKSGGGLIGDYPLAEEIIKSCLKGIKDSGKSLPLSVKTRIGVKESIVGEWIEFLSKFPLSLVTVHGRLLKNQHSGPVDWKKIAEAAKILKKKNIYCLGNGGVKSIIQAERYSVKYNLDGVLIGRGAWGNPWAFKRDCKPSVEEVLKIADQHVGEVDSFYDPGGFVTVRKHLARYIKGFDGAKTLKANLLEAESSRKIRNLLADYDKLRK